MHLNFKHFPKNHNFRIPLLTGCDSTASFSGIGKRKSIKILKEKRDELFLWLEDLGSSPILDVNSEYV